MGKTVLITGASSGIGRATAALFAEKGWNVVATMRSPGQQRDLAPSPQMFVTRLDLLDLASIGEAVAAGIARFGQIDALVNNAGFGLAGVFEGLPREKIREQFEVNVVGVMDVTRAVLPHFRRQRGGVIVNISSRAGLVGLPTLSL
jgi:NAD(P)-dependent dehydrogenase (short-subunit alcohol dehydrogenase family)